MLVMLFTTLTSICQSGNSNQFIPELIFKNPVLVFGTAGQDGAIYKFSNVATDIDAFVRITARSSTAVTLTNIDVTATGWDKAFQPQLGIAGNVPANQNWWMEFEMRFYKAGTINKVKIKGFQVTAIDIDGDGVSIQEYLQMNKVKSVALCPVNYLLDAPLASLSSNYDNDEDDKKGFDKMLQGPVQNFINIDTLGTNVMATFTYEDKDMITFRYGAKSGAVISNAGERLNSLWFKAFSLAPPSTLPVKLQSFAALYDRKDVQLTWITSMEENFSHFVIEKSIDGKNFSNAAVVLSTGTSKGQEATYSFKDKNVSSASAMLYYRIRFVENTGESSYSDVRVIRLTKEQKTLQLTTYPNPVTDQLRVTLPNAWQGKSVMLEVFNSNGSKVQGLQINNASQTETIKFGAFSKGFYVVKATCEDIMAEQRIIKN